MKKMSQMETEIEKHFHSKCQIVQIFNVFMQFLIQRSTRKDGVVQEASSKR